MNGLDPKNVIIYKSLKKKRKKCSDGDFKKQTEIENENISILTVEGFFHDSWRMKYKRPRVFRAYSEPILCLTIECYPFLQKL